MKNKATYIVGGIIVIIIIFVLFKGRTNTTNTKITTNTNSVNTIAKNNIATSQTDPEDIVPGLYKNNIVNTSSLPGLKILSGIVENNLDMNGKTANDHLELVLKNSSKADMANFEAYYTITDLTTLKKEGYYKKLTGFTLKAGETKTIHFDNGLGDNHFGLNTNGMYFTGRNKMQFDVQVSTPGFKIATIQIAKDAGGAEQKD